MPANEPFTAFYSERTRALLPCLSGQETKVFLAVALSTGADGTGYPGLRCLSDYTTYSENVVSDLLEDLEAKELVVCIRKNGIDPYTKRMLPDVYAVNPAIVLIPDPSVWHENRLRHASIPESTFPLNSVQADRITEAESYEAESAKQNHSFEGAALLQKPNANTPMDTRTEAKDGSPHTPPRSAANSPNGQERQRSPSIPPGSGAPPLLRDLTFPERTAANAIRNQVKQFSHETIADLVIRYGVEQCTAAYMSYKDRAKQIVIKNPAGWIIQNLKMGEKKR